MVTCLSHRCHFNRVLRFDISDHEFVVKGDWLVHRVFAGTLKALSSDVCITLGIWAVIELSCSIICT